MSAQTESCRQGRLGSAESEVPVAETDRFGFLLGNSITAGDGPSPVLVRQQEVKWLNLMSHWEHFLERKTKKVKAHCQKGIPASLRAKCWPLLCGATHRREQNKNLYMSLDASPGQQSWIDIIQRDTNRQFPFHEMFLSKDSHGQQGLLRVLKAYTEFRPEEGYCQAQGPVAAVLLMNMPTEEAFWCLVQISELYLPGYYSPKLEGVLFDAALLYWVLKRACPAAYRHLHSQGVEPLMFATDWLMCLYSRHLPFNTLLRVWDLFFCYGVRVLFQVAVVLVRRCLGGSEQRRECEGQMETLEQLRSVQKGIEKEPTDTFLQEVCSVPLSNRELQRQTERELETWRREHPGSNFDPRWRCYGYQMAWERGRERQREEEKQVWQRGNLSLPLQRSASSVSPLLFRRRWKKRWSKADVEDSGGSGEDRGAKSGSKEENKDRDAVRNYKYDACEEERDMEVTSVTTVDGSTHIQQGHTSHTDVASEDPTVKVEQQDDSGTVFTDESSGAKTQLHNSEETHNEQHQDERKQHDDKEEEPRNTHLPQPNPEASSHNVQLKTSHSNTEQQGAAQTFSDQQEEAVKTLSGQPEELQSHQCKQKENIHTISEYHDEKKTQRDRPETEVKTHTSHQEEETETYKNQEEEKLTLKKLQRIHTQMVEVEMKIQKRQLDEKNLMSCGLQKITLSFEDHQVNNTELGDGNQEEDVCQATELQTLCSQQAEEREATKEIPPPLILEGGEINPLLNLEEEEIMPIIYSEKEIQTSLNLQEEEIQPSLNLQEEDIQPSVNLQEEDIQLCLNLQEEDIQLCLNLQEEDIQPSLNVQEEEIQSLLNLEEERLSHQDEQIQQWNMNEEDIQPHLNIDQEESLIPKQCEEIQQSLSLEELQPSVGLWDNDNQPQSSHFTSEDKEIKSPLTGYEEEIPPPLNLEEPIQTPLSRQDEITPQQPLRLEDIQQPVNLHNNETKPFLYQEEDTESCLGRQSPPDQYGNHFKSPVCQDIEVQPQSQQENIIQKPFCQQEETQQPHSQQEFEIQTHIIQQEETKEADVSSEETEDRVDLTDIPGDTMRDKDKSENKERDNETMCHIISQTESISSHLCQEAPKSENPYQAESVLYPPDHKVQLRNRGHSLEGDSASKRVHQQSPEDAAHDINPSPNLTNAIPSLKSCIQKSKSTPTTPTPNPSTPMRLKRTSSSRTSYPTILSEETFKDPNKRDYQEEHTNPPSQMCCPQTTAKAHTNQTTPSPEAATLQHTQTTEMGMAQSPHAAKTDTTQNKGKSKTETLPNHAQQRETSRPKGLLRRLRGESTPKVKVPKILIQDFSEGEQKLSSKERRRRRREQEKKEKEEERERKRKEKEKLEKGKGREGKKPQTRGQSFQVPSKTSTSEALTQDGTRTLPHERNSAPVFDNYF